jgi:hypothetical protein
LFQSPRHKETTTSYFIISIMPSARSYYFVSSSSPRRRASPAAAAPVGRRDHHDEDEDPQEEQEQEQHQQEQEEPTRILRTTAATSRGIRTTTSSTGNILAPLQQAEDECNSTSCTTSTTTDPPCFTSSSLFKNTTTSRGSTGTSSRDGNMLTITTIDVDDEDDNKTTRITSKSNSTATTKNRRRRRLPSSFSSTRIGSATSCYDYHHMLPRQPKQQCQEHDEDDNRTRTAAAVTDERRPWHQQQDEEAFRCQQQELMDCCWHDPSTHNLLLLSNRNASTMANNHSQQRNEDDKLQAFRDGYHHQYIQEPQPAQHEIMQKHNKICISSPLLQQKPPPSGLDMMERYRTDNITSALRRRNEDLTFVPSYIHHDDSDGRRRMMSVTGPSSLDNNCNKERIVNLSFPHPQEHPPECSNPNSWFSHSSSHFVKNVAGRPGENIFTTMPQVLVNAMMDKTRQQVHYPLQQPATFRPLSFSLPSFMSPADESSRSCIKPNIHVASQYNQQGDEKSSNPDVVDEPDENDVISGRGNGPNKRLGNIRFREIVSKFKDMYNCARSTEKQQIALAVIRDVEMQSPPGRFLVQNEITQKWQVLEKRCVIKKVLQALREPDHGKKHSCKIKTSFTSPPHDPEYSTFMAAVSLKNIKSNPVQSGGDRRNRERLKKSSIIVGQTKTPEGSILPFSDCNVPRNSNDASRSVDNGLDDDDALCWSQSQQSMKNNNIMSPSSTASQRNTASKCLPGSIFPRTALASRSMVENADTCHSALLAKKHANFAYVLNYENMTIKSSFTHSSNKTDEHDHCSLTKDETRISNNQLLHDISVIASTCSDLTPLYVMVRAGSMTFTTITNHQRRASRKTNIVPTRYDVLVNATEIHNHAGNLRLAECIQYHFHDYMKVALCDGGVIREQIVSDILKTCSITTADENSTSRRKRERFSQFESTKRCPCGRFLILSQDTREQPKNSLLGSWTILSENDVNDMIVSLLRQAASFILYPHPKDVLLNRQDVSILNPGNMYYKSIIRNFNQLNTPTLPEEEIKMAMEIVGIMITRQSRFLGHVEGMGMWAPLAFQDAVQKTRQLLFSNAASIPYENHSEASS